WSDDFSFLLPCAHVPEADRLVSTRRNQGLAVGRKGLAIGPAVALPGTQAPAGRHVPDFDPSTVICRARKDFAIWRQLRRLEILHGELAHLLQVSPVPNPNEVPFLIPFKGKHELPVRRKPDASDPIAGFRQQVPDLPSCGGIPDANAVPITVRDEL